MLRTKNRRGSLVVVGTGITGLGQVTLESLVAIETADLLFFVANSALTAAWLQRKNPSASSLDDLYAEGKDRRKTYVEMAARVVRAVRAGHKVCVAVYGHPGVFVQFTHLAIETLRAEGHDAQMLPGISTDACLVADLQWNPGDYGVQSFETTDFLRYRRRYDPTSTLVLWQAGVIGDLDFSRRRSPNAKRLSVLVTTLRRHYPANHVVVLYRSNAALGEEPSIRRVALSRIPSAGVTPRTTVLIPPRPQRSERKLIRRWMDASLRPKA